MFACFNWIRTMASCIGPQNQPVRIFPSKWDWSCMDIQTLILPRLVPHPSSRLPTLLMKTSQIMLLTNKYWKVQSKRKSGRSGMQKMHHSLQTAWQERGAGRFEDLLDHKQIRSLLQRLQHGYSSRKKNVAVISPSKRNAGVWHTSHE